VTPEQQAAYIIAMAACSMAEVAGMQAENQARVHRGETPAYPESAFTDVIARNGIHHNAVLTLFRS
jgi:hypothetical protein